MSRLLEQCEDVYQWESLWTEGPTLVLIRALATPILRQFKEPSVLRQLFTVKKIGGPA